MKKKLVAFLVFAALGSHILYAQTSGNDAKLRQTLSERIPQLQAIDEIRATPMQGLYEVRIDTDVFYTDAQGDFLIQGELIDTRARHNLTEDRLRQLTTIAFDQLPIADAITIVRGTGTRKVAVFQDPNCGYCKRFERDLQNVNDLTIHLFLYPILSPASADLSRDIWCAKDPAKAWAEHMLGDKKPPVAACDASALQRNLAFGRKYKVNGTPTLIFSDNKRVPGAISAQAVEEGLVAAAAVR